MKKTTIYLVRHAEVQNSGHIIYGRLPGFHLCSRGRFQAERLRDWFSKKDISVIITSPLLRARQTAEIISDGRIPIKRSKKIIEVDYKKWEGMRADRRPKIELKRYIENPAKVNLGETLIELEARMRKAIDATVKRYPGENIVMVSHADPILVSMMSYNGKPLSDINNHELRNASITTLVFDENGKFLKSGYNEIVEARKDLP